MQKEPASGLPAIANANLRVQISVDLIKVSALESLATKAAICEDRREFRIYNNPPVTAGRIQYNVRNHRR